MHDATETAQTEGDGPEGSDKPPHDAISRKQQLQQPQLSQNVPQPQPLRARTSSTGTKSVGGRSSFSIHRDKTATSTYPSNSHQSIPLPPPEAGALPKEPGHTKASLGSLVVQTAAQKNLVAHGSETPSLIDSPSGSESESWGNSTTSTRPPSRVASRAPSMSREKSGAEAVSSSKPLATATKKEPESASTPVAVTAVLEKPKAADVPPVTQPKSPSRPPSVHSDSGRGFTLKDLLSNGPKLNRKSSARSTASSKKSDSDGERRSTAGDSVASLSKKYGTCERVAIGKGATSVVRLAHKWDNEEEKLYAVKEFRKRRKNETEKEYVKKLTAEFCISSTLHHVNIVETVDLVQDEYQRWCEVMEYCPGGDLYAAIKKGGMSPSEVECCFKQMLCGVEYLHRQGVAHRDIKPENLFFNARGQLKIGDYGASTVYRLPWETTVHMSTGLCGSEPYIAPELFASKPYDARLVDIWACGIVYYCLHFQELPWRVAQMTDSLYAAYVAACQSTNSQQASCPPTIANLKPRGCRPLIRKMLEPDPKLRWKIEDVIGHTWVKSIAVCHEMEKPNHVHVYARALAQGQANGSS